MANIIKRVWNQNRMVQIEDLKGMTFQAEQAGHTFQISGIDDDGNTVALTGTPSGVLLRPDNTDVALTCSVSGGVVSATLPANCYDVPGRFGLTIFITSGSSKTAIYAAVGTVSRTSSGSVAPGTSQSVVDLINAINAAVNSIPASYSALLADIAPTYSNSSLYSVGQYAWYDGDLKRCIVPITTAESYTAAHWTSAVLGQDVSDLKSALNVNMEDATGIKYINTWASGKIRTSTDPVSLTPEETATGVYCVVSCSEGDKFMLTASGAASTHRPWAFLNASLSPTRTANKNSASEVELTAESGEVYLVCNAAKANLHLLKTGYINGNLEATDQSVATLSMNLNARITELDERTEENLNEIRNCEYVLIDFDSSQFEVGSISGVDGRTIDRDNRIRSIDFVPADDFYGLALTITSGYKIAIAYYSANDGTGFIEVVDFISVSGESAIPSGAKYCKFVIADTEDSSSITVNDCDKVNVSYRTKLIEILSLIPENNLPDYWVTYMGSKLPALNNNDATLGRFGTSFVFITDVHIESNAGYSPALLRYVVRNTNIKHIVCGGDIIGLRDTKANAMSELKWWMRNTSGLPVVNLLGNHDLNNEGQSGLDLVISKGEFYALECRQAEDIATFAEGKLYGYSDNRNQKIRFIYLDTDAPLSAIIDDEQILWMKARIAELETGWTVIVFSHQFFTGKVKTEPTLSMDGNGTKILNALNEIYDSVNATIACVIVGHVHRNYTITSEKGFPVIATTCDCYGRANNYDPDVIHTQGTITEQAFDLFYLDTYNRTIKVVRIGAGDTTLDRNFTY